MSIYHFLNLFLYFELLVLVLVFLFILFKRVLRFFSQKIEVKKKESLSLYVSNALKNKEALAPKGSPYLFLEILEAYDRRIQGEHWETVKNKIAREVLLPKARRWSRSYFWLKRNFSARVFCLTHFLEDEPQILSLLEDASFLVRGIASAAAIKMESRKGILKTLYNMEQEPGYGRYYYTDLLSQGSQEVFKWIIAIASSHPPLHQVCLEILAMNTISLPIPFLSQDFSSKEEAIRIPALKIAIRNPQMGSVSLFIECLDDSMEKIRVLGGIGLGNYGNSESIKHLQKGLIDPSTSVRLACAKSLKKLDQIDQIQDGKMKTYVELFG